MAFKQPRVPTIRDNAGVRECIRELVLFLKDFCAEAWSESRRQSDELKAMRRELDAIKDAMSTAE